MLLKLPVHSECFFGGVCWVFIAALTLLYLRRTGSTFHTVRGRLIAVASLIEEHGPEGAPASVVVVWALEHRLNNCGTQA